jgi:hypothetical protein
VLKPEKRGGSRDFILKGHEIGTFWRGNAFELRRPGARRGACGAAAHAARVREPCLVPYIIITIIITQRCDFMWWFQPFLGTRGSFSATESDPRVLFRSPEMPKRVARGGAKRRPAYKPQKYLAVQRPLGIHKRHSVSRTLPAQHNELGTRTHDFGKAGTR